MSTEEEDNYIRIALLLTGISPRAVRYYFDQEFHPSFLERTMRQGRNVLTDLKTKRVINAAQWDLLFPRTGNPESKKFDVTLMITLLRNLASVPVPDDLPVPTDTSKGAALGTIKYYRNHLAHLHDSRIDTARFNILWTALEKAIQTLGGTSMYDEATKLRTKVLDKSNIEIMLSIKQSLKEIQDLRQIVTDLTTEHESLKTQHQVLQQEHKALEKKFMDPVPPNIRAMIKSTLELWKNEDKMFAVTSSAKAILKCCIENLYMTITGNSGMGKTATLRHVALQMAADGYDVIMVQEPSEVKQYYNPEKKTVFVVDDFCGKYSADRIAIEKWGKLIENSLRYLDNTVVKIIVCCRLQVFQDELFDTLSLFKSCVCNLLSNDFKLSRDDLLSIARVYLKRNADKVVQFAHLYDCFPLLCNLYSYNSSLGLGFFENPFTVYETELNQMYKRQNYVSYCALALCVMFNNNVEEEFLTEEIAPGLRLVFENTFETCKLNRGTSRLLIRDSLNSLNNTYIKKKGNVYKTIHDKLFDYLSFYFGKRMTTCLIKNADIVWISKRLLLDEYKSEHDPEFTVCVGSQFRSLLKNRLIKEWFNGQIYHIFSSVNMKITEFREDFYCHVQSLDTSHQNNLAHKTDRVNQINLLIPSCFYGDKEWISWCFDHGISVNMTDSNGVSPLHVACQNNNQLEIVKMLLDMKADVNMCTIDTGVTPLHTACYTGHIDIVKMLLHYKANINQCTTDTGATPLHMACASGHTEIIQILIDNKANIDQHNPDIDGTPLHMACQYGYTQIVQILLDNKANVNQCTFKHGITPLIKACYHGHIEIVQILIDNKANINQCSKNICNTPLFTACQNGHTEIVKKLLNNQAEVNQCTTHNKGSEIVIDREKGNKKEDIFICNNLDTLYTQDSGATPLIIACLNGHTEIVKILLVHQANINQFTYNFCWSPLYLACYGGHTDIVQILLEHKAYINQCTVLLETPLYIACQIGHTEIVQILIDNDADINVWNEETGSSPLCIACKNGHIEITKIILDIQGNIRPCLCPQSWYKFLFNEDFIKCIS